MKSAGLLQIDSITALGPPWAIALVAVGTSITLMYILIRSLSLKFPADLPRVRESPGSTRFSLKTRLAYYLDCDRLFQEAYEKYSKHGKTCLMPSLGTRNDVVLPLSSLKWAISQSEKDLSVYEAFRVLDQAEYNVGGDRFVTDPWVGILVKTHLNRSLEMLSRALNDEVGVAWDQRLGFDTKEWKEVNIKDTMKLMVAQGSSRFTTGTPLCRNEEYLRATIRFTELFVINAGLLPMIPGFLKPILGPLVAIPIRRTLAKVAKHFGPVFEERVRALESGKVSEPQDFLDMMVQFAVKEKPDDMNVDSMNKRLAMMNLGSYHQTSITSIHMILNIVASDPEYNTIAVIREEVDRVLGSNDEGWSKGNLAKMIRLDSILRENLRLHAFGNRAILRVVTKDGLLTEDGIALPKGACTSILVKPVTQDEEVFPHPKKFDPFRYSRIRENTASGMKDKDGNVSDAATTLSFVSTGPMFLPFGHGKHACPGRFILDFELKMLVAYLLKHYDVEFPPEYKGQRPKNFWVAEALMPPTEAKIRVRRREI